MRAPCLTAAIVLRSRPYGESDKIVSFLTERYGKITGIAKGAKRSRRRFVNVLEPFSLVNLQFLERPHTTLAFVHACDLVRVFKGLGASLEKITAASFLLELAEELTNERDENRQIFEHLREGLIRVDEQGASPAFLAYFEFRLLQLSGYQPVLEKCRRCGESWHGALPNPWSFSLSEGGIVCDGCVGFRKATVRLSCEALAVLRDFQKAEGFESLPFFRSSSVVKEVRAVLLHFIQFQISRELKSAPFIEDFSLA